MRTPAAQFTFTEQPATAAYTEDNLDLEAVERVESYRTWLRLDREHYAQPREQRSSLPRMPKLPSTTDYAHATAYAAL